MKTLSLIFSTALFIVSGHANGGVGFVNAPEKNAVQGQCHADRGSGVVTIICTPAQKVCYTTNDAGTRTTAADCILGPGFDEVTSLTRGNVTFNHGAVTPTQNNGWSFANTTDVTVTP